VPPAPCQACHAFLKLGHAEIDQVRDLMRRVTSMSLARFDADFFDLGPEEAQAVLVALDAALIDSGIDVSGEFA
jgi:hypothetical protein